MRSSLFLALYLANEFNLPVAGSTALLRSKFSIPKKTLLLSTPLAFSLEWHNTKWEKINVESTPLEST